jgi:hypothetical protein
MELFFEEACMGLGRGSNGVLVVIRLLFIHAYIHILIKLFQGCYTVGHHN